MNAEAVRSSLLKARRALAHHINPSEGGGAP